MKPNSFRSGYLPLVDAGLPTAMVAAIAVFALIFSTALLPAQDLPQSSRPSAGSTAASQDSTAAIAVTSSMDVLDDKRPLESGDVIAFRIVEDRSAPFSLIVTDSGEVEVPFIGRVYAKGKSPKELAYEIKAALEKEHYQKATVIIGLDWLGTRREGLGEGTPGYVGKVNVWGAVGRAGPIAIPTQEGLTIAEAILAAGGFTPFANQTKVRVHRVVSPDSASGGPDSGSISPEALAANKKKLTQIIIINVKDIIEEGNLSKNISLQANDVIIVEEKFFNF